MNERSRRAATRLWCPLLVRFLARATRQISSPKRRATTGRCRAEFRAATEPESPCPTTSAIIGHTLAGGRTVGATKHPGARRSPALTVIAARRDAGAGMRYSPTRGRCRPAAMTR
jgi:hypothetical protein